MRSNRRTGKGVSDEKGYRDPETLRRLYHDEGMTQKEIGDLHGVSSSAIGYRMRKEDVERRSRGRRRVELASYRLVEGYPEWYTYISDGSQLRCSVHQLLACLENDPKDVFDEDTHVHHKNSIKRDNRAKNLEVMTSSDHLSHHHNAEVPECKERVIQSAAIMQEERA